MSDTSQPLYKKIAANISSRLESGEFSVGDRMYSIDELRKKYDVSSTTAVKAVDELKKLDLIKSIKGKGSFFCGSPEVRVAAKPTKLERMAILSHSLNFFRDNFQMPICRGLEDACEKASLGFRLQFIPEKDFGISGKMPFTPDPAEGLIMIDMVISPILLSILVQPGLKSILIDNVVTGVSSAVTDNYRGVRDIIDHLYSLGHHNLLLGAQHPHNPNHFNENERMNAFQLITEDRKIRGEIVRADDHQGIISRINSENGPTAVMFTQDDPALEFIEIARNSNIRIPEDISVSGFDDCALNFKGLNNLTTLAVDSEALGRKAVEYLCSLNGNHQNIYPWIRVPGGLEVRETTTSCKEIRR